MLNEAVRVLMESQNPDGGWGSIRGKLSNTESTALAMMALRSLRDEGKIAAIRKAEQWFMERQNPDGSWSFGAGAKSPSWSTALAIIALSESANHTGSLIRAGNWVLSQEGSKPGILAKLILALSFHKNAVKLNEDLIGWSWTPWSFSWVEPTSYCLIALKKIKSHLSTKAVQARVDQAELMIYDRMCEGGGWNYGNSVVYGDALWPYPDITAIALIALQDHQDRKENQLSLRKLVETVANVDSGLALGWSLICMSLYGQDGSELKKFLDLSFARTKFLGENKALALGILGTGDGARFFRV